MPHKKLYFSLGIVGVIILAAIVPPQVMPSVKRGMDIPKSTAQDIIREVKIHFDHPAERLMVVRYQITDQGEWRGESTYTVIGRTVFGIKFNRADVYMSGGVITIPSLENDLILLEAPE